MIKSPFLIIITGLILISCTNVESQQVDRMVNLDSHSLHVAIVGTGSPTVVIDGGIGTQGGEYRGLQDKIASFTTVVTYDRAGYGSSEAGPLPRDSRTEVEELRNLLKKLEIPPPYLLVGHSLGGLNVQLFAGLYPEEVAGMVLLDPPPLSFIQGKEYTDLILLAEKMTEEWQSIAERGLGSESEEEKANAEFFQMIASEHREMFNRSVNQVSTIDSFDSIPLIVFASGIPNPGFGDVAEAYQVYWAEESKALALKSKSGQFVFAEDSSHQLHNDVPDLIVEKIQLMVDSLKNKESTRGRKN